MVTKYRKMEKFKNPKSKIVFLPLKVILHIYPSPPFQQQQHHYFIRSPPPIFFTRHSITQLHPPFALYLSFHPIIFFPPPSLSLSLSLFFLPGKQANGNWRVDGDAAVIRKLLSGPPRRASSVPLPNPSQRSGVLIHNKPWVTAVGIECT